MNGSDRVQRSVKLCDRSENTEVTDETFNEGTKDANNIYFNF